MFHNLHRRRVIFVIILPLLLVGAAIATLLLLDQDKNDYDHTSAGTEAIANWNVYDNEEYGFQFKYPDTWQPPQRVSLSRPSYLTGWEFSDEFVSIYVYKNPSGSDIHQWYLDILDGKEYSADEVRQKVRTITRPSSTDAFEVSSYVVGNFMVRSFFPIGDMFVLELEYASLAADSRKVIQVYEMIRDSVTIRHR